jgi:hypothetical protein
VIGETIFGFYQWLGMQVQTMLSNVNLPGDQTSALQYADMLRYTIERDDKA